MICVHFVDHSNMGDESEFSSDEDDADFLGENTFGGQTFDHNNNNETLIIEGEEPIDLLDKQAIKRVICINFASSIFLNTKLTSTIAAKPKTKKDGKPKKEEFRILPDGRLLILEDGQSDEEAEDDNI